MPFNSFLDYPMSWKPERKKLNRPLYLSLAEQLEKDIAAGYLIPGTKLPPQRELADFLDIHFTTVTRAYRLCELYSEWRRRRSSGRTGPEAPEQAEYFDILHTCIVQSVDGNRRVGRRREDVNSYTPRRR